MRNSRSIAGVRALLLVGLGLAIWVFATSSAYAATPGETSAASTSSAPAAVQTASSENVAGGEDSASAASTSSSSAASSATTSKETAQSAGAAEGESTEAASSQTAATTVAETTAADAATTAATAATGAAAATISTAATTATASTNAATTAAKAAGATTTASKTTAQSASQAESSVSAATDSLQNGHVYQITTRMDSRVVEVAGASTKAGANVQMYSQKRMGSQWWKVSRNSDGSICLLNYVSGHALAVSGTSAGANVAIVKKGSSALQKWRVQVNSDGSITLVNVASGYVLGIAGGSTKDGANVKAVKKAEASSAQKWLFADLTLMWSALDAQARANKGAVKNGAKFLIGTRLGGLNVMDVADGSKASGANVQSYDSNSTKAQRWIVRFDSKGYATIKNAKSKKVLDASGAAAASGTNVQQWSANKSRAQKWIIVANDDGTFTIFSALWDNVAIDIAGASKSNGANIHLYDGNDSKAQKWWFVVVNPDVASSAKVNTSEWHIVKAAKDATYVMDLKNSSSANGANIQLCSNNGSLAQTFKFVKAGSFYFIRNADSGKVLDVADGDFVPGTNVQQWARVKGNGNQLFSFKKLSDGAYAIINVRTGLALTYGKTTDGANLTVGVYTGKVGQRFTLGDKGNLVKNGMYVVRSALSSKLAMTVKGDSAKNAANVNSSRYLGCMGQKWQFKVVSGKTNVYTIAPYCSSKVLFATSGGNVKQLTAKAKDTAQQWKLDIRSGSFVIKNVKYGKVLDVAGSNTASGTNIQIYKNNGSKAQRWSIGSTRLVADGTYLLKSGAGNSFVLDVAGGSIDSGANVQIYKSNGTAAQRWIIAYDKSVKAYTLVNKCSGMAVDVQNGNANAGSNVQQYTWNDSTAQKWVISYAGGGYFKVATKLNTDRALAIGGKAANGKNVKLASYSGVGAQKWRLCLKSTASQNSLKGLDISHWNEGINLSSISANFVILKATEGTTYTDPTWAARAKQVVASGKLLGFYHFVRTGDATAQADYFVNAIGSYAGRALLALDWEDSVADPNATDQGASWAKTFLDRVYARTGTRPLIYMNNADLNEHDWSSVASAYRLWYARYWNKNANKTGYISNPDLGVSSLPYWGKPTIYQYSSTGKLSGYGGVLDMNKFYGSRALWNKLVSGS